MRSVCKFFFCTNMSKSISFICLAKNQNFGFWQWQMNEHGLMLRCYSVSLSHVSLSSWGCQGHSQSPLSEPSVLYPLSYNTTNWKTKHSSTPPPAYPFVTANLLKNPSMVWDTVFSIIVSALFRNKWTLSPNLNFSKVFLHWGYIYIVFSNHLGRSIHGCYFLLMYTNWIRIIYHASGPSFSDSGILHDNLTATFLASLGDSIPWQSKAIIQTHQMSLWMI